jgi:hypothetical protein
MSNPTSNFNWQMPTATDLVTDLPADFEVFGQAVDTSLADLKGGTTGQVLKKNTNADMDFVWGTDTGMTNPMTTTGDTIYSSSGSTPARLGIGTTGQVLAVSGGLPAWTNPSSGWTLITSGTLSSTTTTVSSISTAYTDLKILFIGMVPSSAGANIWLTYNNTDNVYNPGIISSDGADQFGAVNAAVTTNKIGNVMATTGTNNAVQILMQDYSRANGWKRAEMTGWNARNGGNDHWFWYQQRVGIASAINRFDVTATAGNLSGSYFVYGI